MLLLIGLCKNCFCAKSGKAGDNCLLGRLNKCQNAGAISSAQNDVDKDDVDKKSTSMADSASLQGSESLSESTLTPINNYLNSIQLPEEWLH